MILLILMLSTGVYCKPSPHSKPDPSPWDWQMEMKEQEKYDKFNMYELEMKNMINMPYFGKVENKITVKTGEAAFLPCRVKNRKSEYLVR